MPTFTNQLLLPSLIGDALALGPHWVYEPESIATTLEACDHFTDPMSSYHPGKRAGDQTHYGDQTLLLWKTLQETGKWNAATFKDRWINYWETSGSYRDKATRTTLESGIASPSDDLGGAARLAPLLDFLADQPLQSRVDAAREQTALTHQCPLSTDTAEFITRVADILTCGENVSNAFQLAAREGRYQELNPGVYLQRAAKEKESDPFTAIKNIGQACGIPQALPAVFWIVQHCEENPREALTLNARVGGDSAARGLVLGLWLGALHGDGWIPQTWRNGLHALQPH